MSDTQQQALQTAHSERPQPLPASQPDPAALNDLHNLNSTEGVDTSADEN